MASKNSTRQLDFFGGPEWPEDNISDFECDSLPGSPVLSSGYESLVSGDLDLYDAAARCVR